jgi:hypothetical protein
MKPLEYRAVLLTVKCPTSLRPAEKSMQAIGFLKGDVTFSPPEAPAPAGPIPKPQS